MTLISLLYLLSLLTVCAGLECYVCHNQPHNKDKCIKTTKQCDEKQMACMTKIKWSQPPFWVTRAIRIHTLFKDCVYYDECKKVSEALGKNLTCKRDWFKDWECLECCRGDKCNYYATMGVGEVSSHLSLLLPAAFLSILQHIYWSS